MIFLLSFLLISAPLLVLCLLVYAYRSKASESARHAQDITLYAANLEGKLSESQKRADDMTEIARQALEVAAEKQFPDTVIQFPAAPRPPQSSEKYSVEAKEYAAPIVAFCSICNVSVRHEADAFPVPCPACSTLIDPILDNPPEL